MKATEVTLWRHGAEGDLQVYERIFEILQTLFCMNPQSITIWFRVTVLGFFPLPVLIRSQTGASVVCFLPLGGVCSPPQTNCKPTEIM